MTRNNVRYRVTAVAFVLLMLSIAGCGTRSPNEVVVYTSVDQVFSESILKDFEKQTGITVKPVFDTEETKSTGVLNRLIAEQSNPQCDVFWSGDPMRALILKSKGITAQYSSPHAQPLAATFKDAGDAWVGFSARARVILYNTRLVTAQDAPRSVFDFTNPRWKGRCAIANPLFGTTTFHMAALYAVLGDEKARELFREMKANGVVIASSNGDVQQRVSNGELAFGLVDTDDANEALKEGKPVALVFPDADGLGTLVIPNTLTLIKGGPHPDKGRLLIDFLLTKEVEARLAESCAQLPLLPQPLRMPGAFAGAAFIPMRVDYERAAGVMETIQPLLKEWVQ